jgi:hypothetical protein
MLKKHQFIFITALFFIATLSPACKHDTTDGMELYQRSVYKNIVLKKAKVLIEIKHD